MGLSSAEFQAWQALPLQQGAEVAQVTWDGQTSSVDWVTIAAIVTDSGTPRLELDSTVAAGTSGGGVFLERLSRSQYLVSKNDIKHEPRDGTVSLQRGSLELAARGGRSLWSQSAPTLAAQPPAPQIC